MSVNTITKGALTGAFRLSNGENLAIQIQINLMVGSLAAYGADGKPNIDVYDSAICCRLGLE
jgi:hypothetical protein